MCEPTTMALIASSAMAAGGTVMQMSSADEAAAKQQNIINQTAAENANLNTQKANLVQDFTAKTYDATARDTNYENAADNRETSLVDALLSANDGKEGESKNAAEGNLSDDYTRAKATSTAASTEDILKRARLMARSSAGGLMYGNEALQGGQLSSEVAGINSSVNRNNNYANTALSGVRNTGSLAGGLLTGLAPVAGMGLSKGLGDAKSSWESSMKTMSGG